MPHTEALFLAGSINLGLPHGDDGEGVAQGVNDFQSVALLLAGCCRIMFDHVGEIALAKVMRRNFLGKNDKGEGFVFNERGSLPSRLHLTPPA